MPKILPVRGPNMSDLGHCRPENSGRATAAQLDVKPRARRR